MEEIEEIRRIQNKLYEESSELADKMSKLDITLHSYNSTIYKLFRFYNIFQR